MSLTTTTTTTLAPPPSSTAAPPNVDDGMSGGTAFCLLFMFVCLVYFGGGIVIRKFLRGAEGPEMIPHYEFWKDVPNLIRVLIYVILYNLLLQREQLLISCINFQDGIMFTINGCQPEMTYERI